MTEIEPLPLDEAVEKLRKEVRVVERLDHPRYSVTRGRWERVRAYKAIVQVMDAADDVAEEARKATIEELSQEAIADLLTQGVR